MSKTRSGISILWLVLGTLLVPSSAPAQFPPQPPPPPDALAPKPAAARPAAPKPPPKPMGRAPRTGEVETVPIKCWWKTDTTEIRIGQRFGLTLTCGVIETQNLKVTANTNSLDPGAVQLTPFEVASGVRHDDVLSPPWRYLQYEYQVRLLSEGFFGQDVTLPSLRVTYNIQAAAGDGAEGRDLQYALPALPLRVASLVPRSAADIRDVSGNGFDAIATRRFRASAASVAGGILVGFAVLLLVFAVARALGRVRRRRPAASTPLAAVSVLGTCLATLRDIKAAAARDGWSPALARRALAPLRVAGAVGLGRTIAQMAVRGDTAAREGQLAVHQGWLRRRRVMVSAATTSGAIEQALAEGGSSRRARAALEQLRSALQLFSVGAYGRTELDTIALDRALSGSTSAIGRLRLRSLLPFGAAPAEEPGVAGLGAPSMTGNRA